MNDETITETVERDKGEEGLLDERENSEDPYGSGKI